MEREQIGTGRRHGQVPPPDAGMERTLYLATHGDTAWDEPGEVEVARLIRWYCTLPGCSTGGSLHIVLDDFNCDDRHIEWCRGYADGAGDTCGSELAGLLDRMGAWGRVRAIMLANGDVVDGVRLT